MSKTKIKAFDIASVALMTAVITLCSYIAIPVGSVPITLQTFAVFCSVGLLGTKKGTLSVLLYLLLGCIGIPVFSSFQGGIGVLAGPAGGFVLGFIMSAVISGLIIKKAGRGYSVFLLAFTVGLIFCYIFGTVWFVFVYSQEKTGFVSSLTACVFPYVIPDMVKIILASMVTKSVSERIKI